MNTKALNNISYGLYVLFSRSGQKSNGCIINTFMQQASDPMTVSVTVNKNNLTHDLIAESGRLNVSVLDQTADFSVFRHFGFSSGRDTDKISGYEGLSTGANDIPYLSDHVNSFFSCKVIDETDLGTHTQFVATVGACDVLSDEESLTYAYYHKHVKPQPEKKIPGWKCSICGYILEQESVPEDFVCPICKHGPEVFEKTV